MAKKILLVEDSPTTSKILRVTFESAGYDIVILDDGNKVLESIGTISEVTRPIMVTGIATMNPANGPEIPTSNNAFLFGIGS